MIKKILSHILMITLSISFFIVPTDNVRAYDDVDHENNIASSMTTYFINEDGQVIESLIIDIDDIPMIIERVVNFDNTSTTNIIYGDENYTVLADADYNTFYQIASSYMYYSSLPSIALCNLQTSNFKHVYVGQASPSTFSIYTLRTLKTAAKISAFIASAYGNIPLAAIATLTEIILDNIESNAPAYKIKIYSDTYEVWFSYDNVYYTHCYHQTLFYYDEDDNFVGSAYDYYQSIGG